MVTLAWWQLVATFVGGGFCALLAANIGAEREKRKLAMGLAAMQALTGGEQPKAGDDLNEKLAALRARRGRTSP